MNPANILLVEDDPNDVELIQIALGRHSFANQIRVVQDGEQAIHYLLGRDGEPPTDPLPKLLLLDLKLPKISGIQVLEIVRTQPRTQAMIVVVMTSSAENQDLQDCYRLGVNSYIVKPLDFHEFVEVSCQIGLYWMMLNQLPSAV